MNYSMKLFWDRKRVEFAKYLGIMFHLLHLFIQKFLISTWFLLNNVLCAGDYISYQNR